MSVASRSWLSRQLQHCARDSGAPLLYRQPGSRPLAGRPAPGGHPFPESKHSGPAAGVSEAVAGKLLRELAPSGQPGNCIRSASPAPSPSPVGEKRAPRSPAKGQLAAENEGCLLEKVKQGEEIGNFFLLRAKFGQLERDLHAPGALKFYTWQVYRIFLFYIPALYRPIRFPLGSCISYLRVSLCWTMASLISIA